MINIREFIIMKMLYKEQTQFIVYPRVFECVKFSYKGEYFFRFKLYYQSGGNSPIRTWAYPYLAKSQSQSKNYLDPTKRSKTNVLENEGHFQSRKFSILFENETQYFNDLCLFSLQTKIKKQSKGYFGIVIEMLKGTTNLVENKATPDKLQIKKTYRAIDTKDLKFNRKFNSHLSQFYNVEFTEGDYFGTLSFYIGAVNLGKKIRKNKYTLCQFVSMPGQDKTRLLAESQARNEEKIKSRKGAGKLLRKSTTEHYEGIIDFYKNNLLAAQCEYLRLISLSENLPIVFSTGLDYRFDSGFEAHKLSTEDEISDYYETNDINQLYFLIQQETTAIILNIRYVWQKYQQQLLKLDSSTFLTLCKEAMSRSKDSWQKISVIRQTVVPLDNRHSFIKQFKRRRSQLIDNAKIVQKKFHSYPLFMLGIEDPIMSRSASTNCISLDNKSGQTSLVVFVHGYHGSSYDLEKASSYLLKNNEKAQVLMIKSMESAREENIDQIAHGVAEEVKTTILTSYYRFTSISFVGYSLGGIIIRALLKYLEIYRNRFNLFITLSSPHLGTFVSDNNLVRAGIWFMIKFNRATALQQIHTGKDMSNSSKSYLKMLSEDEGLSWFKKVILVSCMEDQFVPHPSAIVKEDPENDQILQIANNIRKRARAIEHMEVWFDCKEQSGTLDKLTGRKAHIQFIDNDRFLQYFFHIYGPQF